MIVGNGITFGLGITHFYHFKANFIRSPTRTTINIFTFYHGIKSFLVKLFVTLLQMIKKHLDIKKVIVMKEV